MELAELLTEAREAEGVKAAEAAKTALDHLLKRYQAEDDIRAMRRLVPEPSEAQENTGEPAKVTAVWGPLSTANISGGPQRGEVEAMLRHVVSLGESTVVEGQESSAGAA